MSVFLIGAAKPNNNELLGIAEELDEHGMIVYSIDKALERLERWRNLVTDTLDRRSMVYGYMLEQYDDADRASTTRSGALFKTTIGSYQFGGLELLEALYKLSEGIHHDDLDDLREYVNERLPFVIPDTQLMLLTQREEEHLYKLACTTMRHIRRYRNPEFIESQEYPDVIFIREAKNTQ